MNTATPAYGSAKKPIIIMSVIVLVLVGAVAAFIFSGGPVASEMACSEGQAPANYAEGGSECFDVDAELPKNATWDPRGNYAL